MLHRLRHLKLNSDFNLKSVSDSSGSDPVMHAQKHISADGRKSIMVTIWQSRKLLMPALVALIAVVVLPGCEDSDDAFMMETDSLSPVARAVAPQCSSAEKRRILDRDNPHHTVSLTCSLTLSANEEIPRRLILEGWAASNVKVNCNGGKISPVFPPDYDEVPSGWLPSGDSVEIRSKEITYSTWEVPTGVTLENCVIDGSIRVWGIARNGQGSEGSLRKLMQEWSKYADYTDRLRRYAPKNITLRHLQIRGRKVLRYTEENGVERVEESAKTPLYIGPGVTGMRLEHSTLKGDSNGPGVYLDAESGNNQFYYNRFQVSTRSREQIAIDGSDSNSFWYNRISGLNHGGLYLYRNGGEGGVSRINTPAFNEIKSNIFYYNTYRGDNPAVWLGSRTQRVKNGEISFCDEDATHPLGSGRNDKDHAQVNSVRDNFVVKRSPSAVFESSGDYVDTPNYITGNQKVDSEPENDYGY